MINVGPATVPVPVHLEALIEAWAALLVADYRRRHPVALSPDRVESAARAS